MTRCALLLAMVAALSAVGCQSIGELPGIDPTDNAYSFYQCDVMQVYPQPVPQLQSSALEAMADLGYTDIQCEPKPDLVTIRARTLDGRPARITIRPRNEMSSMTVRILPIGDEMVAQALIQRVALNFGSLPRSMIPLEPALARRIDPLTPRRLVVPPPGFNPVPPEDVTPPAIPENRSPFAPPAAPPLDPDVAPNPLPVKAKGRLRLRVA